MSLNKSAWPVFAAFFLALAFIYFPTLTYPFQFDDYPQILFNRAIRYLDNPRVFIETMHQRERPLTNVSFALNYALHGLDVKGFHAFNVLLHFLNAVLFGFLLKRLFRISRWHWLAALIFLLHPMAVDAVTYISGRSTLLVLFFSLAALNLFLSKRYILVALCGFLGFFSKESAAILPVLLLSVAFIEKGKLRRADYILLAAFFFCSLVLIWIKWSYLVGAWSGFFRFQGDIVLTGPQDFFRYWLAVWWQSLELFINPRALSIDHSVHLLPNLAKGRALVLYLFFLGNAAFAWQTFRRRQFAFFFGILWFFTALAPTHSIVPVLDPIAEHNLYLALPGFALILTHCLFALPKKTALASVVCLAFFVSSAQRKSEWRSHVSLWRAANGVHPESFRIAFNYADALVENFSDERSAFRVLLEWLSRNSLESRSYEDQKLVLNALVASGAEVFGASEREWKAALTPLENRFWRDYIFNEYRLKFERNKNFIAEWKKADAALSTLPSPLNRDAYFWRNRLALQMAEYYRKQNDWRHAKEFYEEVFKRFPQADELPYWQELFSYSTVLRALGEHDKEQAALEQLMSRYLVYKIYFPPALLRLAQLYEAKLDWQRAADAYGELIRTAVDDPNLRKRYSEALAHIDPRRATAQSRQYDFFAKRRVANEDPREWLSH